MWNLIPIEVRIEAGRDKNRAFFWKTRVHMELSGKDWCYRCPQLASTFVLSYCWQGKFIRINFDVTGYIVGANIEACILVRRVLDLLLSVASFNARQ